MEQGRTRRAIQGIVLAVTLGLALAGCAPVHPLPPVGELGPPALAGEWVGSDAVGVRYLLTCGRDGSFDQVVESTAEISCRQVGWFWVEDGAVVVRYRSNDCSPELVGHGAVYPIRSIGDGAFVLDASGTRINYRWRRGPR